MTRTTIVSGRRRYMVSGLEPRLPGGIHQAVVAAQLVDGLTGAPVEKARLSTSFPRLRARAAHSGFVGLVGDPSRALPGLATTGYDVDLLIEASGYAALRESVAFPAQPAFPQTFEPADLGVLRMRRDPVVVGLATLERDAADRPVPVQATVQVTGSWATLGALPSAADTTDLLAVGPGLSAPRPAGATVELPVLSQPPEPPRRLAAATPPGAARIPVTGLGAMSVGDLVGLDLDDADRAERVEVVAVDGPADPASPADLVLRFPLVHGHREGGEAVRIEAPGPAAAAAVLAVEALAGDWTLLVSSLAGLAPGQVVRVDGGGAAPEYRVTDLYTTTTDTDGFGRLPPLTGVAAVSIAAAAGALGATGRVNLIQQSPAVDLTLT